MVDCMQQLNKFEAPTNSREKMMRLSVPKSFLEKRLGIIKWLQCSDVLFHVNQEGIELWCREPNTV